MMSNTNTQSRSLNARYAQEGDALCERIYQTHSSYSGRQIMRGEPLPLWHRRAARKLEGLNRAYEEFWMSGPGHQVFNMQRAAGNKSALRSLENDNDGMYEALRAFHKGLTPYWQEPGVPFRRVVEPAVLIELRPKRGACYAAAILFGKSMNHEIAHPATLISDIGNEGGVKQQYVIGPRLPRHNR